MLVLAPALPLPLAVVLAPARARARARTLARTLARTPAWTLVRTLTLTQQEDLDAVVEVAKRVLPWPAGRMIELRRSCCVIA